MYPAPKTLQASLFTTLPEELHYKGEPTDWSKAVRPGKRIHSFLEGPCFDGDGNLFVSDVPHGRILRVTPSGEWSVAASYEGQPNGLAFHRDGRLIIADHRFGIVAMELANGEVQTVSERHGNKPYRGCSDLTFASNGDLYFTDAGSSSLSDATGCVYRIGDDGNSQLLVSGVPYPNGIVLNPDETEILLAVTRANAVWRFAPDAPTTSLMVGSFIQLSGGLGPDGLAVDIEGRLAVAHARNGTVWIFDQDGAPVYRIFVPSGKSVTNVAYGGDDNKTLFITEADSGSIFTAELDVRGRPLPYLGQEHT